MSNPIHSYCILFTCTCTLIYINTTRVKQMDYNTHWTTNTLQYLMALLQNDFIQSFFSAKASAHCTNNFHFYFSSLVWNIK